MSVLLPVLGVLWWINTAPPVKPMEIVRVTPKLRMLYVAVCNKCRRHHKVKTEKIAKGRLM